MSHTVRQVLRRVVPIVCRTARPACTIALRKIPLPSHCPSSSPPPHTLYRHGSEWTADSILDRIIYVLQTYDKVDADKVHVDADLVKDLGLDSLDIVEVCYHVERSMNTWISDEERETVETVRDVWEIVMHKLLYRFA